MQSVGRWTANDAVPVWPLATGGIPARCRRRVRVDPFLDSNPRACSVRTSTALTTIVHNIVIAELKQIFTCMQYCQSHTEKNRNQVRVTRMCRSTIGDCSAAERSPSSSLLGTTRLPCPHPSAMVLRRAEEKLTHVAHPLASRSRIEPITAIVTYCRNLTRYSG